MLARIEICHKTFRLGLKLVKKIAAWIDICQKTFWHEKKLVIKICRRVLKFVTRIFKFVHFGMERNYPWNFMLKPESVSTWTDTKHAKCPSEKRSIKQKIYHSGSQQIIKSKVSINPSFYFRTVISYLTRYLSTHLAKIEWQRRSIDIVHHLSIRVVVLTILLLWLLLLLLAWDMFIVQIELLWVVHQVGLVISSNIIILNNILIIDVSAICIEHIKTWVCC